jgi:protoporphyrinogen oxidase
VSVIVLGAGITGLTLGLRLARAGRPVLVLEKEPEVGGLCRTFRYGSFAFDIGPHRLFSSDPEISDFFLSVLNDAYIAVPRVSRVRMNGVTLDWPISFRSATRMPARQLLGCLKDVLALRKNRDKNVQSLEDFILARYGRTIYEAFWEGYTEKFLGIPCRDVDSSWGSLSVGRSVVDNKTQPVGLLSLLGQCAISPSKHLQFLYPRDGMDTYPRLCADMIQALGGEIAVDQHVREIRTDGSRIQSITVNDKVYDVDEIFWTGPLTELSELMGEPGPKLSYLSTVLYNIEVEGELEGEWQWIYFPDRNCIFSRVSRPCKFQPDLVPPGMTGLCVEVTGPPDSPLLAQPENLKQRVINDLVDSGLVSSKSVIRDCHIERIDHTYPVYRRGFLEERDLSIARLRRYENLHLVGRQSCFVHNNIDEAVRQAIDEADLLLGGSAATVCAKPRESCVEVELG